MTATRYDFTLEENCDTDFTVQVYQDDQHTTIQDLTGWQATLVVRDFRESGNTAYFTLTSNPAAGLTINGPAGQIAVHFGSASTTGLTWFNGQWDLVATGSGAVKRAAYGNVSVRRGV